MEHIQYLIMLQLSNVSNKSPRRTVAEDTDKPVIHIGQIHTLLNTTQTMMSQVAMHLTTVIPKWWFG